MLRAAWYAPGSQCFATSNQALLAAQAARDAVQKAQLIRSALQHPYHADPSLLAAFAVFTITSPTGVKTAAGDIISRPPLSALPLDILQSYAGPDQRLQLQLDFREVRHIITPSGANVYVIPGKRGLCLASGNSITIRNSRGTRTTIPVPDGIYVSPGQRTANHQACQAARQAAPGVAQKCLPRAQ